jgi:hypothetical protein
MSSNSTDTAEPGAKQSPRPFSPQSLAARWGCTPQRVHAMCRKGDLAYFRIGKFIRISYGEVERLEGANTAHGSGKEV